MMFRFSIFAEWDFNRNTKGRNKRGYTTVQGRRRRGRGCRRRAQGCRRQELRIQEPPRKSKYNKNRNNI